MIWMEISCTVTFAIAYAAYFAYKECRNKMLGILLFAFGFVNFLCAIILFAKMIRSE